MEGGILKQRLQWFKQNSPYPRGIELIETQGDRIQGLSYCGWSNGEISDQVYVKRNSRQQAQQLDVESLIGFSYQSYVSLGELRLVLDSFSCARTFLGVSTYDSVTNLFDSILRDLFESRLVLSNENRNVLDRVYYGVKHFQEIFIVNEYPEWWGTNG